MKNIIEFKKKPTILATFTIGGPKESCGPMAKYIHKKLDCDKVRSAFNKFGVVDADYLFGGGPKGKTAYPT